MNTMHNLKSFEILFFPAAPKVPSLLHICQNCLQRAEREVVALKSSVTIGDNIIIFLNRLSDLSFFVLSRFENKVSNHPDTKWLPWFRIAYCQLWIAHWLWGEILVSTGLRRLRTAYRVPRRHVKKLGTKI